MTPNVTPSQLNLAVGGSGVLVRMIVDGSSGGRPRGRRTKVNRETPIIRAPALRASAALRPGRVPLSFGLLVGILSIGPPPGSLSSIGTVRFFPKKASNSTHQNTKLVAATSKPNIFRPPHEA